MNDFFRYVKYKQFSDNDFEVTESIRPAYKCVDRSRKDEQSFASARSSLQRAHKKLFEVLRCNTWLYFVTLTFAGNLRLDDDYCRLTFQAWRLEMRDKFPNMYYLAVPEYHKNGGLHYHIVLGGVSADDLGLVDSGLVYYNGVNCPLEVFIQNGYKVDDNGNGATIYNITSWVNGFSTATVIRSSDAVAKYVGKYISKADIDPRFYNKKRFYTSHNINRPRSLSISCNVKYSPLAVDSFSPLYLNDRLRFVQYDSLSKEEVIKLRLEGELPIPIKHIISVK